MGQFLQRVLDLWDPNPPLRGDAGVAPVAPPRTRRSKSPPLRDDASSHLLNERNSKPLANPERPAEPLAQALAPAQFAHPRASRRMVLATCDVAYAFRRAKRTTIGMHIGPDGLEVRAPRWVTLGEVESALQEKADWIVRKLVEMQAHQRRLGEMRIQWRDGVVLRYLGQNVQVVLDSSVALKKHSAQFEAPSILRIGLPLHATPEQIRDAVQAWLMRQAKDLFTERLDQFAPRLGVTWQRLTLSSATTRWGTASADGAIRLNWRLIHYKLDVIDYVVAHELSHLRVMNHSPQFWDTVKSVMPDYPQRRRVLRDEPLAPWG